jgi:hypothetical protein
MVDSIVREFEDSKVRKFLGIPVYMVFEISMGNYRIQKECFAD